MKTKTYLIITTVVLNAAGICLAEAKKDDAAEDLVRSNTTFALDLYGQLKRQEGNLFFSPYSISTALAMTWAGAKSQTDSRWPGRCTFRTLPTPTPPAG